VNFLAAGVLLWLGRGLWWWPALPASQLLILLSWRDVRFSAVADLIVVPPVVAAYPKSRLAGRRNRCGITCSSPAPAATPAFATSKAVFKGDFRNALRAPWMQFTSKRYHFVDPPARLFRMRASSCGLPLEGLHFFRGGAARLTRFRLVGIEYAVGPAAP